MERPPVRLPVRAGPEYVMNLISEYVRAAQSMVTSTSFDRHRRARPAPSSAAGTSRT